MLSIILVAVIAIVLLLIFLGALALIFLGIRKSKAGKGPFTVLVISASGEPLEGTDVKLGTDVSITDAYGKAAFEVEKGELELFILAEGHAELRQRIRIGESRLLQVRLLKDKPSPDARELEEAISSARKGREEIGNGYNQAIPDYLFNVCLAVHKIGLEEARSQSDPKLRSEALKSASFAIAQTARGMIERRNLSLYAKAKGKKPRAVELPAPRSPDIFSAKQKLSQVDLLITHSAGKGAIYPPLILWKTAQKLLVNPTVFNIRLSMFLLDSAEKMIVELDDYLV